MDSKENPIVFANQVFERLVSNTWGDKEAGADDFIAMRTAYRKLGGTWGPFILGDPKMTGLAIQVVKAWGRVKKGKGSDRIDPGD